MAWDCGPDENGEFDHDWEWIVDWYGDPDVVNGTADCSHWRCRACGSEDCDRPPPDGNDDIEDYRE